MAGSPNTPREFLCHLSDKARVAISDRQTDPTPIGARAFREIKPQKPHEIFIHRKESRNPVAAVMLRRHLQIVPICEPIKIIELQLRQTNVVADRVAA